MTAVAMDEGQEDPFGVTGAIPGLIQRCQNGSEVTVVRGPSPPGIHGLETIMTLHHHHHETFRLEEGYFFP